jgi:hypothetical protein
MGASEMLALPTPEIVANQDVILAFLWVIEL